MKRRGFTLVELLVVIAIIAILAAMIMPVMLEAKDAARMRRCVSNLKQLGVSVQLYFDDNNGFGLPIDTSYTEHSCDNPWVLYVKPLKTYVGQTLFDPRPANITGRQVPSVVWACQGDICRGDPADENNRPCWWHWGSSYMYPGPSAYLTPSATNPNDLFARDASVTPRKPMTWRRPRYDILLGDYWFDFHSGYKVKKDVENPEIFWGTGRPGKSDMKCINILFLDQHAAAITPIDRDEYLRYVQKDDNPYYTPPSP